jgi:hypothetical protein
MNSSKKVSQNKRPNLSVPKTMVFDMLSIDAKLFLEVSHDKF